MMVGADWNLVLVLIAVRLESNPLPVISGQKRFVLLLFRFLNILNRNVNIVGGWVVEV